MCCICRTNTACCVTRPFALNMKKCIFCKQALSEVGRAKEHIFPQWLIDEWELSDKVIMPCHFDKDGNVISSRSHTMNGFLSGVVCTKCNHGWMSSLEGACKNLILNLALGKRRIVDLDDSEALILSAWTAKTAFALHTSSNWRCVVPDSHIFPLDSGDVRLPENVFVVGHTYKRSRELSWAQSTTWEFMLRDYEVTETELQTIRSCGYKISIRVGGLFLMVFHNPLSETIPCLWWARHIPLYPRRSQRVYWNKEDRAWPENPRVRFGVFSHMLTLVVDKSEQNAPSNGGQPSSLNSDFPPRRG